jgi:hypothetical protein
MAACGGSANRQAPIDREALVERNNPHITQFDPLASLSVGNGEIAFTVDQSGLQTFPAAYAAGVPLGTQAQWGWHSFPNPQDYRHEETLRAYDFGRGAEEVYAVQFRERGRQQEAANWFRSNPHRLHLGIVGFEWDEGGTDQLSDTDQRLDLRNGILRSRFRRGDTLYTVETSCHPQRDMLAAHIVSTARSGIKLHFPYPTGRHTDDACDWASVDKHTTLLVSQKDQEATLKRILDDTVYYVRLCWEGEAVLTEKERNYFVLSPQQDDWAFTCSFSREAPTEENTPTVAATQQAASAYWTAFWKEGAAVDFSLCTDPRAKELERRVVLSQYLLAIQCAGTTPPQETGLTYNSWFGKFHLEMIWWHQAHWALWNRPHLLAPALAWYDQAEGTAREIALRQHFDGIRWMKMTDPSGMEAPSDIGSFLVWQQPHYIYLAELLYRQSPSDETLRKYGRLVEETATFMVSFATYEAAGDRYLLKGLIPAQETLPPAQVVNPPFELSYWHFALETAQKWRERKGEARRPQWDELLAKLSPLAYSDEQLYLAAETAPDTYDNVRYTSDHPAVLGAAGLFPLPPLLREDYMLKTLQWVLDHWNWESAWGWDYPMTAMCAARLGEPEKAVAALLMDQPSNTYLPNGHNYQNEQLRIYLPGNGGLLAAIALMCAGWDGSDRATPGFPSDGSWEVRWEGLSPFP